VDLSTGYMKRKRHLGPKEKGGLAMKEFYPEATLTEGKKKTKEGGVKTQRKKRLGFRFFLLNP